MKRILKIIKLFFLVIRARLGNVDAQLVLGYYYKENAEHYECNEESLNESLATELYKLSAYWFEKASQQNDHAARHYLGYMYLWGEGAERDYDLAFKLFFKSAKQGNTDSMLMLSLMYEYGYGVDQNYQLALFYGIISNVNDDLNSIKKNLTKYEIQDVKEWVKEYEKKNIKR